MACNYCDNGRYKKPRNQEEFDRLVERYSESGQFNVVTSEMMALKKVGYDIIVCPFCNNRNE